MKQFFLFLLFFIFISCDKNELEQENPQGVISNGTGKIIYADYPPLQNKPVNIHYFIPDGDMKNMPVVFVMPGTNRDADVYLNAWKGIAKTHNCMVFAFEFPELHYTDNEYITGNVMDNAGNFISREKWTFSLIEPVFDKIKNLTGNQSTHYYLFGHSSGSQFVHRYILFNPSSRVKKAIAANAGWYTLPLFDTAFPYGLKNAQTTTSDVINAFKVNLVVQLGTNDTNTNDSSLRKTPEANAQGEHRYARGLFFYHQSKQIADKNKYVFQWTLREVSGVGHDHVAMSKDAAKVFFD
jgi:poly(3-hydroxybutyrate) depolymerase